MKDLQSDESRLINEFRTVFQARYPVKNIDLAAEQRYLIHKIFTYEAMRLGIPINRIETLWYSRITEENKEMAETEHSNENNTIWVRVSEKMLDKKIHYGRPYMNQKGETVKPALRSVRANFGTLEKPEWGSFSVRDSSIIDATDFNTGEPLKGIKAIPLDKDQHYTVNFSEKVDGKYKNTKVHMTGEAIRTQIISISRSYRESRQSSKESSLEERTEDAKQEHDSSRHPPDSHEITDRLTR